MKARAHRPCVRRRSRRRCCWPAARASFYADSLHGRRTANGERYDREEYTAAHRSLPFGARLCVRSLVNGRTVIVRVNDRGPFTPGRLIDLSRAAAEELGMMGLGIKPVELWQLAAEDEACPESLEQAAQGSGLGLDEGVARARLAASPRPPGGRRGGAKRAAQPRKRRLKPLTLMSSGYLSAADLQPMGRMPVLGQQLGHLRQGLAQRGLQRERAG